MKSKYGKINDAFFFQRKTMEKS